MFYTIYKTTNTVNGKVYIGKHITKDPNDDYLGSGKTLKAAINKYGRDKFKKEVLHVFNSEDEMNLKEKELVTEEFCSRKDTYNICEGGKGGFGYINANGLGVSVKQKEASRNWLVSVWHPIVNAQTPERLERKREALALAVIACKAKYPAGTFLGKKHSRATKEKIGLANSIRQAGTDNSQFNTCWITNGVLNQKIKSDCPVPDGWRKGRVLNKK